MRAFRATLTKEVLDSIKDHVSEVAPMTDPEAPIEEMPEMVRMWAGGRSISDA